MLWLVIATCLFSALTILRLVAGERARRLAELEQRGRQLQAAVEARTREAAQIPSVG